MLILLGRVALGAQPPIVIKLSCGRSVSLCVDRSVIVSVSLSVCQSVQCVVENGISHPDAIWHHRSDGSRDEASSGVWGSVHSKGYFWGRIWGAPLSPMMTLRRTCDGVRQCRDAALFPNYFGQTYSCPVDSLYALCIKLQKCNCNG